MISIELATGTWEGLGPDMEVTSRHIENEVSARRASKTVDMTDLQVNSIKPQAVLQYFDSTAGSSVVDDLLTFLRTE